MNAVAFFFYKLAGGIARIAEAKKVRRVVVSTTAYHMKRSLWMAKKQMPGLELVPWPSGWRGTHAFYDSRLALREMGGLFVYRILK